TGKVQAPSIGSITISGSIASGGSIKVGATAEIHSADLGDPVAGTIDFLDVGGSIDGTVTASTLDTMTVANDLTGEVTLDGSGVGVASGGQATSGSVGKSPGSDGLAAQLKASIKKALPGKIT